MSAHREGTKARGLLGRLRLRVELLRQARELRNSGLFDPQWRHEAYPGAPTKRAEKHFLKKGWRAGQNPGPGFDCAFYLASNPDVASAGMNPAIHYIRFGRAAGLQPLPSPDLMQQARELREAGLFDRDWYRSTYPETPEQHGLEYFLRVGWLAGHNPGPGFDCAFYLADNRDAAEAAINPVIHYLRGGKARGRLPLPPPEAEPEPIATEQLAAVLARYQLDVRAAQEAIDTNLRAHKWPRLIPKSPVAIFVHSLGNIFMREIAELLTAGFAAAGFDAVLHDERVVFLREGEAGALAPNTTRVVVAPHEFFLLASDGRVAPPEWGDATIMLNVEQLHTNWFREGVGPLRRAAAVLDISLQSAAALAHFGLPAAYLPLGYVADFSPFQLQTKLPDLPALRTLESSIKAACPLADAPLSQRPIDIFFIGYLSPRRAGILERMAQRLSRWRCHFILTDGDRPQVSRQNAVLESEATIGLAQRSKIVLNLHQSDEPFFEWHRIVLQGIWQKTLVVSEPVAMQSQFTAGEHFLEAPVDELADLIDWVLGTEAGAQIAEGVRMLAYEQLTERVRLGGRLSALFVAQGANEGEATPQ